MEKYIFLQLWRLNYIRLFSFGYSISFLEEKQTYTVLKESDELLVKNLCAYLDEGEAEVIALAKELNADLLLINEKLGKRYAEAEAIHYKGVVRILIQAKQQGFIQFIKPLLDDLINNLKISFVRENLQGCFTKSRRMIIFKCT